MGSTYDIKKNDIVQVLTGKDQGKTGRVLRLLGKRDRVVVERINMVKRAQRPNPSRNIKGGILEKEASIHVSNVLLLCPECQKPTRIGHKVLDDGSRVRVCRRCRASLEK
ncbi:MAG: 50S ribosomal protein L24 [Acidobacteriota bacterium]